MLKISLYIPIILFLFACNEKEPKPVIHKTIRKAEIVEPVKPTYNLITDTNVVARLTAYGKENPETLIDIYTSKGKIRIKLFKDTPLHRANFILLAKAGYFNHALFSRVAKKFMAQFGGSYDDLQREVQDTIGTYTIPSEMSHHHFHKKGAIAAARSYNNNPKKRSSSDEFYFVEGLKFSDISLDHYEDENRYTFTPAQRNYYKNNPGAAHIDGEHTVFGQIIHGFSVIPKLTHVDTDSQDWPVIDIYIDSVVIIK
ncbi:MAG: peptidylprolyl isomerase [Flavobacteriales bacterium]|nr:peptidylprolyl isomerase [Flavobacteriales bacterium]